MDPFVRNGDTPLLLAVKCGKKEIVTRLLEAHANIAKRNRNMETTLHWAARNGQENILQQLFEELDKESLNKSAGGLHKTATRLAPLIQQKSRLPSIKIGKKKTAFFNDANCSEVNTIFHR